MEIISRPNVKGYGTKPTQRGQFQRTNSHGGDSRYHAIKRSAIFTLVFPGRFMRTLTVWQSAERVDRLFEVRRFADKAGGTEGGLWD